mmetsp:Transcript_5500/g.13518  ORF Transcript_5500/g.13518 Transcript_5500/m.13518 type:complete len:217 (-) Transcript_5500:8-658(-)
MTGSMALVPVPEARCESAMEGISSTTCQLSSLMLMDDAPFSGEEALLAMPLPVLTTLSPSSSWDTFDSESPSEGKSNTPFISSGKTQGREGNNFSSWGRPLLAALWPPPPPLPPRPAPKAPAAAAATAATAAGADGGSWPSGQLAASRTARSSASASASSSPTGIGSVGRGESASMHASEQRDHMKVTRPSRPCSYAGGPRVPSRGRARHPKDSAA